MDERTDQGTINNVFSEAGYEELADRSSSRYNRCVECGEILPPNRSQSLTCSELCSQRFYHDYDGTDY